MGPGGTCEIWQVWQQALLRRGWTEQDVEDLSLEVAATAAERLKGEHLQCCRSQSELDSEASEGEEESEDEDDDGAAK